jgi:hypothetical protein
MTKVGPKSEVEEEGRNDGVYEGVRSIGVFPWWEGVPHVHRLFLVLKTEKIINPCALISYHCNQFLGRGVARR